MCREDTLSPEDHTTVLSLHLEFPSLLALIPQDNGELQTHKSEPRHSMHRPSLHIHLFYVDRPDLLALAEVGSEFPPV